MGTKGSSNIWTACQDHEIVMFLVKEMQYAGSSVVILLRHLTCDSVNNIPRNLSVVEDKAAHSR